MGLFNKQEKLNLQEETEVSVGVNVNFEVCVPENLVSSDSVLAGLTFEGNTDSVHNYGNVLEGGLYITSIYWLQQNKEFADGGTKTIDKFLLRANLNGKTIYFICDIFFVVESNLYVAKVLGSYVSLPKALNANFKHKGELVAEKVLNLSVPFMSISNYVKFDKRCSPLYFWIEMSDLIESNMT